jgi:small subunit ribosomal protein S1
MKQVTNYQVGQLIEATITRLTKFGAFARLDNEIEGLIHISEISEKRIIANPKGRLPKPQKAYRPNRRCDFYFSK